MKIEKVNENQIRCTLTREDLASRELKISELAYGTEKAKNLFRDMMRQANYEFGFEAEDIPLMIEAIPLNTECIVLIITKVEDPEELDTRFSRFAPSVTEDYGDDEEYGDEIEDVFDLFRQLQPEQADSPDAARIDDAREPESFFGIFRLDSLREVMDVCRLIAPLYREPSTLYKDASSGKYFLQLTGSRENSGDFERICNIASEYGVLQRRSAGGSFLAEHCETLIDGNAVQALGKA
ncbi:MAG: adaptor protein MecA [Roseburia sp.]|nr:adaptor protein MecA [Roseburia sp.]MCM1099177.1 adaptor protein MecA [Ruminococcus flavefaciens]